VSVQRVMTPAGRMRFRARVKSHGREVATKYFDRRADAVAWANDQSRHLRIGDWVDPRRGRVSLTVVAEGWLVSRASVKRRTRETDEAAWANYVKPSFGNRAIGSITTAEVTEWLANLLASGLAPSTARRALAVIREILDHAVADERLSRNVARAVRPPRGTGVREAIALTIDEVEALATACHGPLSDVAARRRKRRDQVAGNDDRDRRHASGNCPDMHPRLGQRCGKASLGECRRPIAIHFDALRSNIVQTAHPGGK
jgi:Phage integrase central domain